jgi:hypothetical protein
MKKRKLQVAIIAILISAIIIVPGLIELEKIILEVNYHFALLLGVLALIIIIILISFYLKLKTSAAILGLIGQLGLIIVMAIAFFHIASTNQKADSFFWAVILAEAMILLFGLMLVTKRADQ